MLIGITGSIATGKSVVSRYLSQKGYRVIDADLLARAELFQPDVIQEIRNKIGTEVIVEGRVDRNVLGRIIFSDERARRKLNEIIHPRVIKKIQEQVTGKTELIFVDIPLLYEANLEDFVDKVIVVYTKFPIQLSRLMQRDGIDEEYARRKIATQMDIESKRDRADFVIDNDDDLSHTYVQIENIIRRLKNEV